MTTSAIEDLVLDFEDMCGESGTEMGNAALGERKELRQSIKALLLIVETHVPLYMQFQHLETIAFAKNVLGDSK